MQSRVCACVRRHLRRVRRPARASGANLLHFSRHTYTTARAHMCCTLRLLYARARATLPLPLAHRRTPPDSAMIAFASGLACAIISIDKLCAALRSHTYRYSAFACVCVCIHLHGVIQHSLGNKAERRRRRRCRADKFAWLPIGCLWVTLAFVLIRLSNYIQTRMCAHALAGFLKSARARHQTSA